MYSKGDLYELIVVIALALFGAIFFLQSSSIASSQTEAVKAELSKEVADRIAKNLIIMDGWKKGALLMELPDKYEIVLTYENGEYVVRASYSKKRFDSVQSKKFRLKNDISIRGSQVTTRLGNINTNFGSIEKLCIVKFENNFWFIDSEDPEKFLKDNVGGISSKDLVDGKMCEVK